MKKHVEKHNKKKKKTKKHTIFHSLSQDGSVIVYIPPINGTWLCVLPPADSTTNWEWILQLDCYTTPYALAKAQ